MSTSSGNGASMIELFIWCRDLTKADEKPFDTFAVVMIQKSPNVAFEELQRSETVSNTPNPQFCTSFEISYSSEATSSPMLRLDIYRRKTLDTERLRDHEHRGTVSTSIGDLLNAKGNQLSSLLQNPNESDDGGYVTIAAENVDITNSQNSSFVQIDVSSSVLRKRDWNKTILCQRYTLCRAHKFNDENGNIAWLPIYRSDRMTKQRDLNANVEFSTASINYRHLCNGDEERAIRLKIYAMPQVNNKPGGKKQEIELAHTTFTLNFVCEIDPLMEDLGLEKDGHTGGIGTVSIVKAEPTDFGGYFSFQVNYKDTAKYANAGNFRKKISVVKLKPLNLVRKKGPKSASRSEGNKVSVLDDVNGLFSNESSGSEENESEEMKNEQN